MIRRTALALAGVLVLCCVAKAGDKPKDCVTFAKTWKAAVEEAKTLNMPIVVHSHGFYCSPCWGMHSAVLQNGKYIKFSNDNTVEVIALGRLQEGIDKGDRKAETYDARDENGNEVKYLVEFPGMTIEQMLALASSPAARYNDTGKIPYTCIVDPYTLEKVQFWSGGQSAKTLIEAIGEARKALIESHGPSIARSDLRKFEEKLADVEKTLAEKGVVKALSEYSKLEKLGEKTAPALLARARAYHEGTLLAAASTKLDEAGEAIDSGDVKTARRILSSTFLRRLKGTGLYDRAVALKERMKTASE